LFLLRPSKTKECLSVILLRKCRREIH
jgi:hypothetical protein